MRKLTLAALFVSCNLALASQAIRYSLRDACFVDVESKSYRLVLVAKDMAAEKIKDRRDQLERELVHSNVVLQAVQAKAGGLTPDAQPVRSADDFLEPRFWLIAPDDRVIPFDPAVSLDPLLDSPLRHVLQMRSAEALCVLLLLESTDDAANRKAKTKAEEALEQINQARRRLAKAPHADVVLLRLPAAERMKERWTLWGLGEEAPATPVPKLAVVCGRMRLAGPLLEGTAWDAAELLARMAELGMSCEGKKQALGPGLPHSGRTDWKPALPFDPTNAAVKKEVTELLRLPPEKEAGRLTFEQLMAGEFGDEEHQPPDPLLAAGQDGGLRKVPEPLAPPERRFEPPFVATQTWGIIVFAIGLAGWIALGIAVLIVEHRRPKSA